MKNLASLCIVMMLLTMTSCELIGDIFSAGFYTALILVAIVVAIIIWIVVKMRKRH